MLSEYLQSFHEAVMYLSTTFGGNIFIQLELYWNFSKFNTATAIILYFYNKWIRDVPPWWFSFLVQITSLNGSSDSANGNLQIYLFVCLFIYLFIYLYLFFLRLAYRSDQLMGFTRDSSKHVKSHKDVPFGVIRLKFNVNPLFIPQNITVLP